jgi:hypothetical protein
MPQKAALGALLQACRNEISWLEEKSKEYRVSNHDLSADYMSRAGNLMAVLEAYERIAAKEGPDA